MAVKQRVSEYLVAYHRRRLGFRMDGRRSEAAQKVPIEGDLPRHFSLLRFW